MAIEQKYQDIAGKWRVLYQINLDESIMLKFSQNPSDAEVQSKVDIHIASDEYIYRDTYKLPIIIEDFKESIENAVRFIKITNPTLAQWNTYISTLQWYDASMVRWFIFALAIRLAEQNSINLSVYTEVEILSKLKQWIIVTPAAKLRKIIWGN